MKRLIPALAILAVLGTTSAAWAITVEDIKGLTRAGASDAIILSKIEVDGTVFRLTVDEILELKEFGVSDAVITYMINTGKWADAAVEPQPEPAVEDVEEYPDYDASGIDLDADYSGGLDSRYRTSSFSVSFGYYYPHWPGYWWASYYDPFYWNSWSYYYSYWTPYPYGYWYYDPWYRCRAGVYRYYPYDRYYYGSGDHWVRRDGRHSGNRGDMAGGDRRYKNPPSAGSEAARLDDRFRGDRRVKNPNPGIVPRPDDGRAVKPERPVRREFTPPRNPSPPVREVKPAKPSRPESSRKPGTPQREYREEKPAKPDSRSMKPAPAPSRPQREEVRRPSPPPAPRPSAGPSRAPSKPSPSANQGSTRRSKGGD